MTHSRASRPAGSGLALSFQTRLTLTLLAAAIIPLGLFGADAASRPARSMPQVGSTVASCSCSPSRSAVGMLARHGGRTRSASGRCARSRPPCQRVSAGDMSQPIPVEGTDVLAQLAESHNRLAADARPAKSPARADPRRGRIGRAARRRRRDGRTGRPRRRGRIRVHRGRRAVRRPRHRRAGGADPGRLGAHPRRTAGGRRSPRPHPRQPAGDADLGASRPGSPRPVRQRDRRRHPERRAVRPGPGPEPSSSAA